MSNKFKTRVRDLQHRTGWSYSECRRCVNTLTEQQIEALIKRRFHVEGADDDTQIATGLAERET